MIPQYPVSPPPEPDREILYEPSWHLSGMDKIAWFFLCIIHALVNTVLQTWFTWLVYDDIYYLFFGELVGTLWGVNLISTIAVYLFVYFNPISYAPENG